MLGTRELAVATAIRSEIGMVRASQPGRISMANMAAAGSFKFGTPAVNIKFNSKSNQDVFSISMPRRTLGYSSSRRPFGFLAAASQSQEGENKADFGAAPVSVLNFTNLMHNPEIIACARWAIEDFNRQKYAQLQFVRVVRAWLMHKSDSVTTYLLTLKAVDDEVVKVYLAIVAFNHISKTMPPVNFLALVLDDGTLLQLIDNRDRREPRESHAGENWEEHGRAVREDMR